MSVKEYDAQWARERCETWNWNCNPAEIAEELIEEWDCKPGSREWAVLAAEFKKFFPENGKRDWETITQIVEVFG